MEFVLVVWAVFSAGMWAPFDISPFGAARPVAVVAVVAADRVMKSRREELLDIYPLHFITVFVAGAKVYSQFKRINPDGTFTAGRVKPSPYSADKES
jgi:hypothetical protein